MKEQQKYLLKLLQKYKECFDGTLITRKTDPVDFKLNKNPKPICSKPYPVPKLHELKFKKKIECLVILGVIEKVNYSG